MTTDLYIYKFTYDDDATKIVVVIACDQVAAREQIYKALECYNIFTKPPLTLTEIRRFYEPVFCFDLNKK